MKIPAIPAALVTPFHGFALLSGAGLVASLLWPDPAASRSLFLWILVVLQGILSVQVGEAEHGYGPTAPAQRLWRLFFFTGLALGLATPFLLIHRTETGASWPSFLLSLLFLFAHGFLWTMVGHKLAAVIRSDGLRFLAKYGGLGLVTVVPVVFGIPLSGLNVLPALWENGTGGWPGLAIYLGLDGVGALWWWKGRKGS